MGKTIFIGARKGGVGKTMTAASLGVGLAREGKRTLVIDTDSQFSLTVSLGVKEPDKLPVTLATVMPNVTYLLLIRPLLPLACCPRINSANSTQSGSVLSPHRGMSKDFCNSSALPNCLTAEI